MKWTRTTIINDITQSSHKILIFFGTILEQQQSTYYTGIYLLLTPLRLVAFRKTLDFIRQYNTVVHR